LPDTTRLGNIRENWIIQLYYGDETNFFAISGADTVVDNVFYRGVVTNKPSIRTKINLADSKASTGNVSLDIINFTYNGNPFSEEILGGSNKYINRTVKIYSQINGDSALSDCFQIYSGRLVDIKHDLDKISLQIVEQRPWDFLTIPRDKESISNIYVPIAYGDYEKTSPSDLYTSSKLYPAPAVSMDNTLDKYFILGGQTSNVQPHFFDDACGKFFPILDGVGGSALSNTATTENGYNYTYIKKELYRDFIIKPVIGTKLTFGYGNFISPNDNPAAIYNNKSLFPDDTTYLEHNFHFTAPIYFAGDVTSGRVELVMPLSHVAASNITISTRCTMWLIVNDVTYSSNSNYWLKFGDSDSSPIVNIDNTTPETTSITTKTATLSSSDWNDISQHSLIMMIDDGGDITTGSNDFDFNVKIYDIKISGTTQIDQTDINSVENTLKSIENVYIGGDGLQDYDLDQDGTNYWINGTSTPTTITKIAQAHRDLLHRFAGYTGSPTGWSDIDTDRTNWELRWWQLKPEDVEKTLEKLQKEGCFIGAWGSDGEFKYIYVKDTYSPSDVAHTLTNQDMSGITTKNTPFSQLLTKMNIEFGRKPTEDGYAFEENQENSSARTNWNIKDAENIKDVKLDALVSTDGTDTVQGYWDYYNNIFGDVRLMVSGGIVNPKMYNLEVGDIVQFDLDTKPFGYTWSDKYLMITSLIRTPGRLKFEAREVYST